MKTSEDDKLISLFNDINSSNHLLYLLDLFIQESSAYSYKMLKEAVLHTFKIYITEDYSMLRKKNQFVSGFQSLEHGLSILMHVD